MAYNNRLVILCLLLLGVFGTTSSCSSYKDPTIESLDSIEFLALEDNLVSVKISVTINNPNSMGITLNGVNTIIYIDKVYVGTSVSTQKIKIKKDGLTSVSFDSNIDLDSFSRVFPKVIKKEGLSDVTVDGVFKVKVGLINVNIKSKSTSKMDLDREVQNMIQGILNKRSTKVTKVSPKKVSINVSTLQLDLSMENTFPFDYKIDSIDLDLSFKGEGKNFGNWKLKEPKIIKAKSKDSIKGTVKVENFSALSQLGGIIFNQKRKLFLKGATTISIAGRFFKIPLEQEFPFDASLLGN